MMDVKGTRRKLYLDLGKSGHSQSLWILTCQIFNLLLLLHSWSVVSDSSATPWTVAHQAPRPWNSPGKNTGVGCYFFLQGLFLTQGSNLCHLALAGNSLPLSHLGSPLIFNRKRKEKDTEVDDSGVPRPGSDSICLSAVGNGIIQWEYLKIIPEVVFISLYY